MFVHQRRYDLRFDILMTRLYNKYMGYGQGIDTHTYIYNIIINVCIYILCVWYIYIYIHTYCTIAPVPLSKPHRPRGPRRNHLKALPRTRSWPHGMNPGSSLVFVELGPKISAYHAKKYWWILPINPYKRSLKGDTRYKMVDVSWCVTRRSWRLWGPHSQLFPATSPSCNPMYPICVGEKRWAQGRWLGLVCVCLKRYSVSTTEGFLR